MAPLCYRRHRFPPEIIQHAIWLYLRFTLSYRDVEELLAERGLDISYETVRRWVLKFDPAIARRLQLPEAGKGDLADLVLGDPLEIRCQNAPGQRSRTSECRKKSPKNQVRT
jgi:hypothetical protein